MDVYTRIVRVERGRVGLAASWLQEPNHAKASTHVAATRGSLDAAYVAGGVISDILRTIAHCAESIIIIAMLILGEPRAAILGRWHVPILVRIVVVLQQAHRIRCWLERKPWRLNSSSIPRTIVAWGLLLHAA